MGWLKLGIEAAGAIAAGLGVRHFYNKAKGNPTPPVAPSNPLPTPGVITPAPAPTVLSGVVQAITGSATPITTSLGGGVTDVLDATGLDVTSGGNIGGLADANQTPTSTSSDDATMVDDSTLAGLDAALGL